MYRSIVAFLLLSFELSCFAFIQPHILPLAVRRRETEPHICRRIRTRAAAAGGTNGVPEVDLAKAMAGGVDFSNNAELEDVRKRIIKDAPKSITKMAEVDPLECLEIETDPTQMSGLAGILKNALALNVKDDPELQRMVDEELKKGEGELRTLAAELTQTEGATDINLEMSRAFEAAYQEQSDMLVASYEGKASKIMEKMEKEKNSLLSEMENIKKLQDQLNNDPMNQLASFAAKGRAQQSALVASIVIGNQVVLQLVGLARGSDVEPLLLIPELAIIAGCLWFYGFRT